MEDSGAGPTGRTEEEAGTFTFPATSPCCRINRTEEGAAGGVLAGLWIRTLPRPLRLPLQIKPLACLWAVSARLSHALRSA